MGTQTVGASGKDIATNISELQGTELYDAYDRGSGMESMLEDIQEDSRSVLWRFIYSVQ